MNSYETSYSNFVKPEFSPPAWIFAPVWSVLYFLIAISFGFVLFKILKGKLKSTTAVPFVLNIVFNLSFTYIQFGLKNNLLAFVDIILVLGTLIWSMTVIYSRYRWVALINIPYLLWITFATVLQATITILNW